MPTAISRDQAVAFLGQELPSDACAVSAAGDVGIDQLVLLRFDTSAIGAATFARGLVAGEPVAGVDPSLGYLGEGLGWWPSTPPSGFAGREGRTAANRTIKLLSVPAPGDRRTIYVAAFSS